MSVKVIPLALRRALTFPDQSLDSAQPHTGVRISPTEPPDVCHNLITTQRARAQPIVCRIARLGNSPQNSLLISW